MSQIYTKELFDQSYSVRAWAHGVRDQPRLPRHHYNWYVQSQDPYARLNNNVSALIGGPGWASLSDIAIIGGGFGWTAELLLDWKPSLNIINVETSPHVINNIAVSEEADLRQYLIDDGFDPDNIDFLMHPDQSRTLTNAEAWSYWLRPDGVRTSVTTLDNDLSSTGQRRGVKSALGNNVDALVTEIALDAFSTETEVDNFLDFVEQTRPNPACMVVHLTEYDGRPVSESGFISKTIADWGIYLTARGFGNHYIMEPHGKFQRANGATI